METLINSYTGVIPGKKKQQNIKKSFSIVTHKTSNSTISFFTGSHGINDRIFGLLDSFRKLEDNWDDDDAKAPSDNVIKKAGQITSMLQMFGQKIYHSAPGPNGEIMLDIRSDKGIRSIEIIIYDNRINIVFVPREDFPWQEGFTFSKLRAYFRWLNG